jgi:hypothetical protein
MANVEFSGFDEVEAALKGVRDGMDELNDELMNDGADYAKQEIERAIYQYGEYRTGSLLRSIKKSKGKDKDGSRYVMVKPTGKNDSGASNGQVAFSRNYGRSNDPGSRFWTIAEERAVKKFEEILNQKVNLFFKQKGLN